MILLNVVVCGLMLAWWIATSPNQFEAFANAGLGAVFGIMLATQMLMRTSAKWRGR